MKKVVLSFLYYIFQVIAYRQFSDGGIIASLVVPSIFFVFAFSIMCFYWLKHPKNFVPAYITYNIRNHTKKSTINIKFKTRK